MEVSIFAAFVAGLVSFLSPCVLPLVPGYISMLSGIGVEQLKEGHAPRGGLLVSALAFVFGFSIVFVSFGASASAVGNFLVRNRSLLAPLAGSIIVLFGLHLDWLAGEDHDSCGLADWRIARRRRSRSHMASRIFRRMAEGHSFLLRLADFSSRPLAHPLA